jgi:hypothetical protein
MIRLSEMNSEVNIRNRVSFSSIRSVLMTTSLGAAELEVDAVEVISIEIWK